MKTARKKILVIDDEPDVARAVRLTLQMQEPEWLVLAAHSGQEGLLRVEAAPPDLVLLDLMMPDRFGLDVLEDIRKFSDVPIIILTVQDAELDKVRGLELGADDYIVKPFGHLELMARIHSVLRRAEGAVGPPQKPFVNGPLHIDFSRHRVTVAEETVRLTHTEYRLLEILAKNAGRIVPAEMLLSRVWGRHAADNTEYLKVYLHRLRLKLEDDPAHPHYLITERGEGYWLTPPEEA